MKFHFVAFAQHDSSTDELAGVHVHVESPIDHLANTAGKMQLGAGLDPASELGPLVSEQQMQHVCGYIKSGVEQGATVATGGGRAGDRGYFVKPTVLVGVRQDMRVVQEEIFGPVVVALPYDDIDEVVRLANDTMYGLGASIWSNDLSRVHRSFPGSGPARCG